jgi:hypothetical protein
MQNGGRGGMAPGRQAAQPAASRGPQQQQQTMARPAAALPPAGAQRTQPPGFSNQAPPFGGVASAASVNRGNTGSPGPTQTTSSPSLPRQSLNAPVTSARPVSPRSRGGNTSPPAAGVHAARVVLFANTVRSVLAAQNNNNTVRALPPPPSNFDDKVRARTFFRTV